MSEWLILGLSVSGFWGPIVSRTMPSLVLDGINCPKKDPVLGGPPRLTILPQ